MAPFYLPCQVSLIFLVFFQHATAFQQASTRILRGGNAANQQLPLNMFQTPFADILKPKDGLSRKTSSIAENFIDCLNEQRISDAADLLDDDIVFEDTAFPNPFEGIEATERILRLLSETKQETILVDGFAVDQEARKVGIRFQLQSRDGTPGRKGVASFTLSEESTIKRIFFTTENSKGGESNLKILGAASKIIGLSQEEPEDQPTKILKETFGKKTTLAEQYFAAWNARDMERACSLFSESCTYDDTRFPAPFVGKEALVKHLNICADCLPASFSFEVDDIIDGGATIFSEWHIENNGEKLPFTGGASFYSVENGKIVDGIDFVEPTVFKTAGVNLFLQSLRNKLSEQPSRWIPLLTWVAYMYVVFFSSWFFGQPATALEQRTWEEVRDLSLNFFLVSPILNLPFAPVVHPMMEGVFNLLLSWAAMFAGFLSDDRREKPNLLPMLPVVAGMQFLTSAFLLPYLATRSDESSESISLDDLSQPAQITESRLLAPFLSIVGTGSIFWGFFARQDEFGGLGERLGTFGELLSIDRVGSSFLVDLAIFAAFQGWLIDDDAKRRGLDPEGKLAKIAKIVPFFGMAMYLTFRDQLPTSDLKSLETK